MFNSKTVRAKFLVSVLAAVLILTLAGTWFVSRMVGGSLTDEVYDRVIGTVGYAALRIDNWFVERRAVVDTMYYIMPALPDEDTMLAALIALGNAYIGFDDDTALFGDGWVAPPTWLPTRRPWYIAAANEPGGTVISPLYIDADTGNLTITFSRYVGLGRGAVFAVDLFLPEVLDMVWDAIVIEGSYAFMADQDGYIIVHTKNDELLPFIVADELVYMANIRTVPVYSVLPAAGLQQGEIYPITDRRGELWYLAAHFIEETGWTLFVAVPESYVSMAVQSLMRRAALFWAPSIFLVVALIWVAANRFISAPLNIVNQKLQESRHQFQMYLDAAPLAIEVWDSNMNFIGCNKHARDTFGVTNAREYFAQYYNFLPPVQPDGTLSKDLPARYFKETESTGYCVLDENHILPNGEVMPAEVTVVRLEYGMSFLLVIYTRDLREIHKAMENELATRAALQKAQLASTEKSRFLAATSHEIRTPMNAILGMTELMLRGDLPRHARDQAEIIKQSGRHLINIINDMLDFSRIESGKMVLADIKYDLGTVINDVINVIKVRLPGRKLRMMLNISNSLPRELKGDPLRLHQIISNLMSNAVKYTEQGHIALGMEGEVDGGILTLTIRVSDSGIGIKKDDLKDLFKEFSRFDSERNRSVEGTGLGLAITQNLVRLMGGTIHVESEYGKGSAFTVIIKQKIEDPAPIAAVPNAHEKPALVFERRAECVASIKYTMQGLGIPLAMANTHHEFLDALESGKYTHAFVASKLYDSFKTQFPACATDTRIILVNELENDDTIASGGLSVLSVPIYCIVVAELMNGIESVRPRKTQLQFFTAPEANVLVVDDIETNLMVCEGLMRPYLMQVTLCSNSSDAIELVRKNSYDLVLMDDMMPGLSGIEAAKLIREFDGVPIVALTANALVGAKDMYLQSGFDGFLPKPMETAQLHDILKKWIPANKQELLRDTKEAPLLQPAIEIKGVNTERGLAYSGKDMRIYKNVLALFGADCMKKLNDMDSALQEDDLRSFTVHVHSLRSACANIGASEAAEKAAALETAGLEKNRHIINRGINNFSAQINELVKAVNEAVKAFPAPAPPSGSDETLFALLNRLSAALEENDSAAVDHCCDELEDYAGHSIHGTAVSEIIRHTFINNYRAAAEVVGRVMGSRIPDG
jgi:signal transduction histidine kinase/CheY-like chemotaxis protein